MHQKLTDHEKFCMQNNQLLRKSPIKIKVNPNLKSIKDIYYVILNHRARYGMQSEHDLETYDSNQSNTTTLLPFVNNDSKSFMHVVCLHWTLNIYDKLKNTWYKFYDHSNNLEILKPKSDHKLKGEFKR